MALLVSLPIRPPIIFLTPSIFFNYDGILIPPFFVLFWTWLSPPSNSQEYASAVGATDFSAGIGEHPHSGQVSLPYDMRAKL